MGNVTVRWYDDRHQTVLIDFVDHWTWDEFDAGWDEVTRLMGSTTQTVHMILDSSRGPTPPDARVLGHFQRTWRMIPKNTGLAIVVGANAFMEGMSKVFASAVATRLEFRTAKTMQDVDRILTERQQEG
jgi:hypothetical protein